MIDRIESLQALDNQLAAFLAEMHPPILPPFKTDTHERIERPGYVAIQIASNPVAKPRQTQRDKFKPSDAVKKYRAFADLVRAIAAPIPAAALVDRVDYFAQVEMPPHWSKAYRSTMVGQSHRSTPDRDNIDKAVLDSLLRNDSGVAAGVLVKLWAQSARLIVVMWLNSRAGKGDK